MRKNIVVFVLLVAQRAADYAENFTSGLLYCVFPAIIAIPFGLAAIPLGYNSWAAYGLAFAILLAPAMLGKYVEDNTKTVPARTSRPTVVDNRESDY